jgi:hypothetical protein
VIAGANAQPVRCSDVERLCLQLRPADWVKVKKVRTEKGFAAAIAAAKRMAGYAGEVSL